MHAKVYIGKEGAIVGSSNFSHGGLHSNREFNARFHISETQRFRQINRFWDLTWSEGVDFHEDLLELLHKMLRKSPWREALAKAISILLESGWMDICTNSLGPLLWNICDQKHSQVLKEVLEAPVYCVSTTVIL